MGVDNDKVTKESGVIDNSAKEVGLENDKATNVSDPPPRGRGGLGKNRNEVPLLECEGSGEK